MAAGTSTTGGAAARARWAVATIFLLNGFMVGSWAPHIPALMARLGISTSTMGLLILCFGIGALVSMPWCGWLMARFGQRPILRIFGLIQGFGLLLVVMSPTVPVTAVAMVFFGATIGCTDVVMNAATVIVERRLGRAVMSSMHGFWSLGGFAGGGLGGVAFQTFGTTAHAAAVAAVVVTGGLLAMPHFIDSDERPAAQLDGHRRRGLPRTPTIYLLGLVALLLFAAEGAVLDWGALYMTRELGADLAVAGLAYAFFSGAMAVMRFAGDRVRDRFGAVPTLRVSAFVAAAAMLAAGLLDDPILVIAAFALTGLGVANTVPIIFSAAGNMPGMASGTGMSIATTMGYSGVLMAPSAIGFIAEHTGFSIVFASFALILVVIGLIASLAQTADVDHRAQPVVSA